MDKKILLFLFVIIIIASFLRLYHITTTPPGLYPDEAMNGNNALEALRAHNWKVFYPENSGREGLFINIQSLFLALIGAREPWVLRLPSAIFGILTVLGIYFLAAELFSAEIGLLAAFLLATSFWHINFSRIGFRAITAPFFLTWSLFFLLRGFNALRRGLPFRRATMFHLIGGLLFGLGAYTYIAYRVAPLIALPILYFYWRKARGEGWQKEFFHTAAHFIILSTVIFIPLGLYFLRTPGSFFGRTSEVSVFNSPAPLRNLALNTVKTIGMFNISGDYNWRHNLSGQPELFWPIGILFLIGIAIGIKNIVKSLRLNVKSSGGEELPASNFSFSVLFAWFALALLPVAISNEGLPHALRSILVIPPVMIFAAVGVNLLYGRIKRQTSNVWYCKRLIIIAAATFLVILPVQVYHAYFIRWAKNPNVQGAFAADYVALGRQLNELPTEVPKYVVIKAGGTDVRGLPMPAQTTMFITDTFSPENQKAKNIHYVLPQNEKNIPVGALTFYIH